MKKQELIEKLKQLGILTIYDNPNGQAVDMVVKSEVLALIDQLDEPQKAVIPLYVAEWVEYCKQNSIELGDALTSYDGADIPDSVLDWYGEDNFEREELFASAWIDGYEIEQEKLYTVEIPDPNNTEFKYVVLEKYRGKVRINRLRRIFDKKDTSFQLTEAEIKQDFEWAWQWAEEVE